MSHRGRQRKNTIQGRKSFLTSVESLEPKLLLAADVPVFGGHDVALLGQDMLGDTGQLTEGQSSAEFNVGGLQVLPGDTAIGAAEGHQMDAEIFRGGKQLLAVWSDYRSSPDNFPPFATEGSGADIYGRILNADGTVAGESSFVINQDMDDQEAATAAWNGENWLVVWRTQTETLPTYQRLMAARVSADGTVLDETPIEIRNNESYYETFEPYKVASDGQDWVIVFQANGPQDGVSAIRVAADGTLPSTTPTLIHSTLFSTNFEIVFAQDEYLITWDDPFSAPRGRLYTPDLQPMGGQFALPGAEEVATDGTNFLVTYIAPGPGAWFTLKGVFVNHNGAVQNPSFDIVSQSSVCCTELVYDGANYWATWGGLTAARITPDGTVLDPGGFMIGGLGQFSVPHALDAAPGGGIQLVWNNGEDGAFDPKDVLSTKVSPTGTISSDVLLSTSAPAQLNSDFAEGPDMFAVAFESRISGITRVKVQRLDANGAALDAEPIEIISGANVRGPGIAFDGTRYMVTWRDNFNLYGQRMAVDGTLLGQRFLIMTTWDDPDVAGIDGTFLVVGTDYLSNDDNSRVAFTRRVDGATGSLLDVEPQELGHFVIFSRDPHVVAFGNRWLVTWQTNISHDNTIASTKAAFVDLDGTSPGPFAVGLGWDPDLAVSDDRALFVAVSHTIASAPNDIEGRIMLADGTFPAPAFTISDAPDKQLAPAVTFDGENFLVAWEDKRDNWVYDERTDIYGTRVTADGAVLDFDSNGFGGIPLTSTPQPENDAALITSGGTTLFAASTFVSESEYGAFRIGLAEVGTELPGDFNGDQIVNADDINMLCAEISTGSHTPQYDLNGDGFVDPQDMDELILNILGTLYGDANLDRSVDGADFVLWNTHKFQPGGWQAGDFTCDGIVDGSDFVVWNANKFQSGAGGKGLRVVRSPGAGFVGLLKPQLPIQVEAPTRTQRISSIPASDDETMPGGSVQEQRLAAWQRKPVRDAGHQRIPASTELADRESHHRNDLAATMDGVNAKLER